MVSTPHHAFSGFQRPLYLFIKEDNQSNDNITSITDQQKSKQLCETEEMEYEEESFPKDTNKEGISEINPQSGDQYEQLENVYVSNTTSSYDTSSHNNEHQNQDTENVCYDIIMRVVKETETEGAKMHDNHKKLENTGGEMRDKFDKVLEENEETKDAVEDNNDTYNCDNKKEYSIDKTSNDDKEIVEVESITNSACEK